MKSLILLIGYSLLSIQAVFGDLLSEVATADIAIDNAVTAISNATQLAQSQNKWRNWWIQAMGGIPNRTPLNARITGITQAKDYRVEHVLFESQPGVYVTGLLYLPNTSEFKPPYPAILIVHGHSQAGKNRDGYRRAAIMAVRKGFAVFAPDPISQGERRQNLPQYDCDCALEHSSIGARCWLVGWNFARFRIWDGVRSIDYMATRNDLDLSRLAVMGNSGGGTMSAYLQAFDDRIKVAAPNCFISSIREVFRERGAHDAEQFFWGQLRDGFNHASICALGAGRVNLLIGARWADYFPKAGTESTFGILKQLRSQLDGSYGLDYYSCAGEHGWAESSRVAALAWIAFWVQNKDNQFCYRRDGVPFLDVAALRNVAGDFKFGCDTAEYRHDLNVTRTGAVRDIPNFRSIYSLITEEAKRLESNRAKTTNYQEVVRRRAGIRPLEVIIKDGLYPKFDHSFNWWYLKGYEGVKRENEAAMIATLGRTAIGQKAEAMILQAYQAKSRTILKATGADCVAAAHAYAAEPQLFSGIELNNPPPSWLDMLDDFNPAHDSYALGVWGALQEYDWVDLVPASALPKPVITVQAGSSVQALPNQGVAHLVDGELNPTCALYWQGKPLDIIFDLGTVRTIGGVRLMSGRSYTNRGVSKASFYADQNGKWIPIKEHVALRPANTYKENYVTWDTLCTRRIKMVIEGTYDQQGHYYCGYTWEAQKYLPTLFETPPYRVRADGPCTVQLAEVSFFGNNFPADLTLPNADGSIAYPQSRLIRDWLYQSGNVSNISHCANVEPDTTKPDPMGEDISSVLKRTNQGKSPKWLKERENLRRQFLGEFRTRCSEFLYVKHIVMANSIMHATDDLSDASYQEWKSVPDYRGGSQLIKASIKADGSVQQEVLLDEPTGIIRDPALSFDASCVVFSKRKAFEGDDYHLWKLDLNTRKLTQLTSNTWVRITDVPGLKADFEMPCSDIEPCWLPDGTLVFQSTRCSHSVDCWPLPVSNLFRCEADGSNIRRLGFDQVQTFYPQLMDDGRVCYTRWEYNDRSASGLQQLYAMNPDGTKQTGLFANNSEFPFSLMHTRGIPGTRDIMMIDCGHHVAQKGHLVRSRLAEGDDYTCFTYDPAKSVWGINTNSIVMWFPGNRKMVIPWSGWDNPCGPATTNYPGMYYIAGSAMNGKPGVQKVRQPHDYQYNAFDMHSQFGPQWAYPFPLGEGMFLVSFMPEGCSFYRGPYSSRFGVYAMDESGRRELLAFDWGNHCMQPIALKKRIAPPRQVRKLDYTQGFGTYYVQNVYEGAAMQGAPKGCVKRLRVIGLEYRPVHIGWNWQYGWHSTQGKIGTPIAVGNGAYDVKHILGEADVEADGSCSFQVPARTPVYFQLIDAKGCCIQTMRSWSTLQPGEVNGCIGCHEHPHLAGVEQSKALALRRAPQKLKPWLNDGKIHPFIEHLEKEGPLASLDNWMGLNRPKAIIDTDQNDGFSFNRLIQPILNAKCITCHNKGEMDLRGTLGKIPPSDDQSKRKYSTAYLSLSYKGQCNEKINFAHGLGFAAFKPPYSFGSARSSVWQMLANGHPDNTGKSRVALSDSELRTLACWIDLAVPFCGSYVERNDWNEWYCQRYNYTCNKRAAFAWQELNDIRKSLNLPALPLTGFIPNVTMPRRQRYWSE